MSSPYQTNRISEVEYCIQNYFDSHIIPVMNRQKNALQNAQAKEIQDYTTSTRGILQGFAATSNPYAVDDTLQYLQATGKYNSKRSEDYIDMCGKEIADNADFQKDLTRLAQEWRTAVIAQVGRERYDDVSAKMGCDLALAYIDYRVEQMMVDRMVKLDMPKSTIEYVIRKGAENSLLGLPQVMMRSPLDEEIAKRGEEAYNPTGKEKLGARAVSFGMDIAMTGGFHSWGALTKLAGTEVVFAGLEKYLERKAGKDETITVDEIISQSLFGQQGNILEKYRNDSHSIKAYENNYIKELNGELAKRMYIPSEKPVWENWFSLDNSNNGGFGLFSTIANLFNFNSISQYPEVPLVIAPGQEQAYLDWKAKQEGKGEGNHNTQNQSAARPDVPLVIAPGKEQEYLDWLEDQNKKKDMAESTDQNNAAQQEQNEDIQNQVVSPDSNQSGQQEPVEENNNLGWSNLFGAVGLDGFSDITRNLPFVISMLPDMLVGLLTGKTESVGLKKDIIPVASILLGMFIKNPLLKMVLIGMGGANLLNKMGHEAIGRQQPEIAQRQQFKQYANEPLNPRIVNPVLKGNTLIATIDSVPCSITIPENAAQAYASGALPLNTLVNAILARNDNMREMAARNYQEVEMQRVERDRGIGIK